MTDVRNGMPAAQLPGAHWVKSSRSTPTGGNCVEVAFLPDGQVAVRNSRQPAGPALVFTAPEWAAFVGGAAAGEFEPPFTLRQTPRIR
jgi:hypothetical protein